MSALSTTFLALGTSGRLRRAIASYQVYGVVEVTAWVGMVLYAFAEGGAPLAGLVAVVQLVPSALIGPIIVSRVEHLPRGTALALALSAVFLTSLATLATLLVHAPVPVVVTAAATMGVALTVVRPLYYASLPQLAGTPAALVSANSLSTASEGVSYFLGPIVAGFCMQLTGTWLVFAVATALAGLASALCLRLHLVAPVVSTGGDGASWREAFTGLGALWGQWGAIALLLVMATRFVVGGALDILGISFSEEVLGRGASGAGLILGAMGIGGLLGAFIAGPLSTRRRLGRVIGAGGLLQGLGLAAVALVAILVPAMLMLVICGIGGALVMVAGRTLLQRTTDDRVLARVFAVQEGTGLLGWAFGSAVAPVVIAWLGPAGAFVPFGIGCALLTIAALLLIRRLDDRAVLHPIELALLRRVPFLSVLPPYELERLASHATWIDVSPDEVIIRQGDVGDAFYVIAEGRFSVTVDGVVGSAALEEGIGFGEIALLHAVPRTATVTAVTAGRLLSISSDVFLAAVTDSADGHAVAVEVADAHLRRARD